VDEVVLTDHTQTPGSSLLGSSSSARRRRSDRLDLVEVVTLHYVAFLRVGVPKQSGSAETGLLGKILHRYAGGVCRTPSKARTFELLFGLPEEWRRVAER
jgi:hypothetical protein